MKKKDIVKNLYSNASDRIFRVNNIYAEQFIENDNKLKLKNLT